MAANFQDGHHGISRNTGFALDGSRQSKRWFGEWVIYLNMKTVQLNYILLYKHSDQFNMAPNFQDDRHGLPLNTIIYFENNSRQSNKMIR